MKEIMRRLEMERLAKDAGQRAARVWLWRDRHDRQSRVQLYALLRFEHFKRLVRTKKDNPQLWRNVTRSTQRLRAMQLGYDMARMVGGDPVDVGCR